MGHAWGGVCIVDTGGGGRCGWCPWEGRVGLTSSTQVVVGVGGLSMVW